MICAVDTNLTRGADACLGDSGGPLLLFSQQGVKVVGITAFGQACGGSKPGVYTAIYPYLDWIEEQVWIRNNENNKAVVKPPSNKSEPVMNLSFINPIFNITYTSQWDMAYTCYTYLEDIRIIELDYVTETTVYIISSIFPIFHPI